MSAGMGKSGDSAADSGKVHNLENAATCKVPIKVFVSM